MKIPGHAPEVRPVGQGNIPDEIAAELKLWKQAFSTVAARPVPYGDILRIMLDLLAETYTEEAAEMKQMLEKHPELKDTVKPKL